MGEIQNVAVIGLGDIARKAYLPTLGTRADVDLHLMTRNPERLASIADEYRVAPERRFTDLSALLANRLDAAFVHVPTDQHTAVVGRLLDAGVPTYVDKPLAASLPERARETGVPLIVGFNRRCIPAYAAVAERRPDLVLMQKNPGPSYAAGPVRDVVLDDFIHVIDTLRFLLPDADGGRVEVTGRVVDGVLHHVAVTLAGAGRTGIGIMSWGGGSKEERLEAMGPAGKVEVLDLAQTFDHEGGVRIARPVDGWAPVARQRGFEQICSAFLDAVREKRTDDLERRLQDAVRTHEVCELVVERLTAG